MGQEVVHRLPLFVCRGIDGRQTIRIAALYVCLEEPLELLGQVPLLLEVDDAHEVGIGPYHTEHLHHTSRYIHCSMLCTRLTFIILVSGNEVSRECSLSKLLSVTAPLDSELSTSLSPFSALCGDKSGKRATVGEGFINTDKRDSLLCRLVPLTVVSLQHVCTSYSVLCTPSNKL